MNDVPVIDISDFIKESKNSDIAVSQIRQACMNHGFFYISGHGVSFELQEELVDLSNRFFSQPISEKEKIKMENAGRAWRGYFSLGDELTSGKPDMKEGLYFGIQHEPNHPKCLANTIMHGQNQYPENLPGFNSVVEAYIKEMTKLGQTLMSLLAFSLGLEENYFISGLTKDPWILFRIFHYPAMTSTMPKDSWGVGEHTDYGVLTILKQDEVGGLQIKSKGAWIEAPFIENTFICNLGDMFSKMTGTYFQATPHRVKNRSSKGRYSFPFFFDPGWDTKVEKIYLPTLPISSAELKEERWDRANPGLFDGTYGEYITMKVGKVFPDLT